MLLPLAQSLDHFFSPALQPEQGRKPFLCSRRCKRAGESFLLIPRSRRRSPAPLLVRLTMTATVLMAAVWDEASVGKNGLVTSMQWQRQNPRYAAHSLSLGSPRASRLASRNPNSELRPSGRRGCARRDHFIHEWAARTRRLGAVLDHTSDIFFSHATRRTVAG